MEGRDSARERKQITILLLNMTNTQAVPPIQHLWDGTDESEWRRLALDNYWNLVRPDLRPLYRELEALDLAEIRALDAGGWLTFLHDRYFKWKFTQANRLATSRRALKRGVARPDGLTDLHHVKLRLLDGADKDLVSRLFVARQIPGLGIAGASGLLALFFPSEFGTVDQFVVSSLRQVNTPYQFELDRMDPDNLDGLAGLLLIAIMRMKAEQLTNLWGSPWTPRMVDQVLWASRSDVQQGRKPKSHAK